MELRKVATDVDDDSNDSLDFTEPIDSEKATIDRSVTMRLIYVSSMCEWAPTVV